MYRDKTRRKRHAGNPPPDEPAPRSAAGTGLSEIEVQRSAIGIL
jgi:hypothetical protein